VAPRALVLREGVAPVRDRLLTTIFLAAVLHGMIILGLTFGTAAGSSESAPGLQVLLVSEELPEADRNDDATYLAQRTQLGSGNTMDVVPPRNRPTARAMQGQEGVTDGTSFRDGGQSVGGGEDRVLATTAFRAEVRYFTDSSREGSSDDKPLLIEEQTAEQMASNDDLGPEQLRGPERDELWITADSREATLAPYLDAWRRKVERVGTLNYPTAARRGRVQASPVLEVAINSDGKLDTAVIRRSSGYPDLDQAALEILKLASPFDPFPTDLARETRRLRFSYEWQFVGGRLEKGTLRTVR
jgi:periplasmic protein TonB